MATKIYTRAGDEGYTSLLGGTKVSKNNIRIEAYGTVDELNSYIGLVINYTPDEHQRDVMNIIQNNLFIIGSLLSYDHEKKIGITLPELLEEDVLMLEKEIDSMSNALPEMKHFILPGGNAAVSSTHIARCVCRRAERLCVNMQQSDCDVQPFVIKYLNRLSDYLFVLARFTAQELHVPEIIWQPR